MRYRIAFVRLFSAVFIASATASSASAEYPERPVRIIVPNAPGGVTDVILRAAAVELAPRLGQQIIIENRSGGAAGIIGAQACAAAAPDGYTFCAVQHN